MYLVSAAETWKICILESKFFSFCFEISLLLIDNKWSPLVTALIIPHPPSQFMFFGPLQYAFLKYTKQDMEVK